MDGKADGFYGDQTRYPGPPYRISSIMDSLVYRELQNLSHRLSHALPGEEAMLSQRSRATVRCPNRRRDDRSPCPDGPCLFNLDADPCETNNLAVNYIDIASHLFDVLKYYKTTLVPQINQRPDPLNANPVRFNNTWQSWTL